MGAEGFPRRVFKLQVIPCGLAAKVLDKVNTKLPAIAPAWGCGEDNVGISVVLSFPDSPKKSTVRLATCKRDETSLLMSEEERLLVMVGETLK